MTSRALNPTWYLCCSIFTGAMLLACSFACAQTSLQSSNDANVAFEVVSIKPNTSGSPSSSTRTPGGGRFVGTNVSARRLVLIAYNLRGLQLSGGPGWLDSDRFDIDARAAEPPTRDSQLQMLRALLADRFKLVVHKETKEQPIYALVLARSDGKLGPKLKPSTLDCSAPAPQPGQSSCGTSTNINNEGGIMNGGARSAEEIATTLASFVADRMVVDRTGLNGRFDFELRWTPDNFQLPSPAGAAVTDAPSIFAALQEQLGLKLESQRGPVEFLVIDSIERPTPN